MSQPNAKAGGIGAYLMSHMRDYGLLFALIAIMAFFQVVTNGVLLRPVNITNLVLQNSFVIIMALGMLMVIVAGHIDLAVGSVMGFIGALAAVMIVELKMPVAVAIPACLIAGALIGAIQGYFAAFWRIPSFIVTLAGMLIFRGATLWLLQGQALGPFPQSFQALANGFIPDFIGGGKPNTVALLVGVIAVIAMIWSGLKTRAQDARYGLDTEPMAFFAIRNAIVAAGLLFITWKLAGFRGIPNVMVTMVVLILIYAFLTERTTLGRRVYALGGNEKASKLSGIKTERLAFFTFVNMGFLAALGGLILAARLNSAGPKAGSGVELDVIAAVFIGGASMSGGSGKVIGAVIGAFIMGVLNNGMSIMGIGIDYQQMIKGLVLLAAVFFDVYNKQKQG